MLYVFISRRPLTYRVIKSTAGADASVKSLKLYDMKQLTLAYLALLGTRSSSSSRSLYNCAKSGK